MPPRLEVRPLQHLTVHRPITAASGSRLSNLLPVQAAGGLVWRVRKGRLELLIVHRPRYDDWSWPKGKLDPYEVPVVAAAREIAEETGVEVVMGVPLPGLKYTQDGRPKQVHFWAARVADAADAPALAARLPIQRADTAEIDDAMWLDVEKVVDKLTYASDLGPLDALLALRGAGRLATVPKVFVRHARAKKRSAWKGLEAKRPLTPEGIERSRALVPVFAALGLTRLASSPWERCMATLVPYAEAIDAKVRPEPSLTEASHQKHPAKAVAALSAIMGSARPVAVCLHRPVVPAVLAMADEYTANSTLGALPTADPYLRTAEMIVAQVATVNKRAQIVSLERMRPAGS